MALLYFNSPAVLWAPRPLSASYSCKQRCNECLCVCILSILEVYPQGRFLEVRFLCQQVNTCIVCSILRSRVHCRSGCKCCSLLSSRQTRPSTTDRRRPIIVSNLTGESVSWCSLIWGFLIMRETEHLLVGLWAILSFCNIKMVLWLCLLLSFCCQDFGFFP